MSCLTGVSHCDTAEFLGLVSKEYRRAGDGKKGESSPVGGSGEGGVKSRKRLS